MKTVLLLTGLLFTSLIYWQCAATRNSRMAAQNAETVRIWFEEGWNKNRNEELLERVFAPDWADGNPLRPDQTTGIEGMRQFVKYYQTAFSDAHFIITHLFATGNQVAIRYEVSAVHVGVAFGIPPTGKHFTSTGILIYDMERGRIKRTWQELDLMGIIKQLRPERN
ncbi:MAG: ester cyclase [Saprospirales bacterium]|jgi:predicted ester cyclase|nr:ester cyclase [Saprospirales bacterium]MBK8920356.1 ester cyclase [Saprospirales bacterium]